MATISNGESGSSVRTKLNEIINKVEGVTSIDNNIDITGVLSSDGLTVDGNGSLLTLDNGSNPATISNTNGNVTLDFDTTNAGRSFNIEENGNKAFRITGGGDISFYDSQGSSQSFFWDASAESLGIGTSSINSLASLHIQGSDGASGAGVNIAANEFFIDNDGNTGMTLGSSNTGVGHYAFADSDVSLRGSIFYDHSTDNMGFRVSSSTRMTIDSSGNLDVDGTITSDGLTVDGSGTAINIQSNNSAGTARNALRFTDLDGSASASQQLGKIEFYSSDASAPGAGVKAEIVGIAEVGNPGAALQFKTDAQSGTPLERMRIDRFGDISFYEDTGITPKLVWKAADERLGIGTDSPGVKFVVANGADAAVSTQIFGADETTEYLGFGQNGGDSVITAGSAGAESVELVFRTASSGAEAEAMRIDSSGNLLVGNTFAPSEYVTTSTNEGLAYQSKDYLVIARNGGSAVHLNRLGTDGSIQEFRKDGATVGIIGTNAGNIYLGDGARTLIVDGGVVKAGYSTGTDADQVQDLGSSSVRWKDLNLSGGLRGDTTFKNNAGTTEYARFDSSGNLLVGKTITSSTEDGLELRSTNVAVFTRDGGNPLGLNRKSSDGDIIVFNKDAAPVGSISVTGSATAYNTSSDHRLKENVVDLTGATTRLKQLEPKRFNFVADADTTVDGFLAHEVQSVVPEAITGTHNEVDADGNPVYQGIDQSKLVPLLVATIKELEARITALENG